MCRTVTAIITDGRIRIIDHNSGEACAVLIKAFTCIKIVWDRVGKMFVKVLTIITAIWRQGFTKYRLAASLSPTLK